MAELPKGEEVEDKISYNEEWAFIDKNGDVEVSDDGSSSASSLEVVNLDNEVVSFQRRSTERSLTPEILPGSSNQDSKISSDPTEPSVDQEEKEDSTEENFEATKASDSIKENRTKDTDLKIDEEVDREYTQSEVMEPVAGPSGVSTEQPPSDTGDNQSDSDSDFIRLEVTDNGEVENSSDMQRSPSSVSVQFNFIDRDNSPAHQPDIPVADLPEAADVVAPNEPDDDIPSDTDDNPQDRSAEVEEDQHIESEDERIESDQSDTNSIPPLDDDMSFVNDIGDLPLVAGNVARQYVHNPNPHLNLKLDVIAILMFTVVVGLGIGHAIATFDEIEDFDSLHNALSSLRNNFVSCENKKWEQEKTIVHLQKKFDLVLLEIRENQREIDYLKKINTAKSLKENHLLEMYQNSVIELEKFKKTSVSLEEFEHLQTQNTQLMTQMNSKEQMSLKEKDNEDLKLKLKIQINQLQQEKEDLTQAIARLKYVSHASSNHDVSSKSCDKLPPNENLEFSNQGVKLADATVKDLSEIHVHSSEDNSRLKREVGRLRYSQLSQDDVKGAQEVIPKISKDAADPSKCISPKELEDIKVLLQKEKLQSQEWHHKYLEAKNQTLNSTICLRYLLQNLNNTKHGLQLDSDLLEKFLIASFIGFASDFKGYISKVSSEVWKNIQSTTEDIFENSSQSENDEKIPPKMDQNVKNETESENTSQSQTPYKHWAKNVRDILNETQNRMTNVSKQIQDTWLHVKNLSLKFWKEHEPKVTETINTVSQHASSLSHKVQQKLGKWYKKFEKKLARKFKRGHQRHHDESNMERIEDLKDTIANIHYEDFVLFSKKKKISFIQTLKEFSRHEKRWESVTVTKEWVKCQLIWWKWSICKQKLDKKSMKRCGRYFEDWQDRRIQDRVKEVKLQNNQREILKKIEKFMKKRISLTEKDFKKMKAEKKTKVHDKMRHLLMQAEDKKIMKDTNNYPASIHWLECQIYLWNVHSDLKRQTITDCKPYMQDWEIQNLQSRVHSESGYEDDGQDHDQKDYTDKDNDYIDYHYDDDVADDDYEDHEHVYSYEQNVEYNNHAYDHDHGSRHRDEGQESSWVFKRADDRQEQRQKEHEPDWIFDRANHRKDVRESESETQWMFDRASQRKDQREKDVYHDAKSYRTKRSYKYTKKFHNDYYQTNEDKWYQSNSYFSNSDKNFLDDNWDW